MSSVNHKGFTLIEVLVAMVLLSLGLMGVAALQMESMRSTQNAQTRARAVVLAADIAERMRTNRGAALAGAYVTDGDDGANQNCTDDLEGGPTVVCTPALMVDHDLWQWRENLTSPLTGLPGEAVGSIASDGAPVPTFTIEIAWQEKGEDLSYSLVVQL